VRGKGVNNGTQQEDTQTLPENFLLFDLISQPLKEPDWIFPDLWQARTPGLFTGDGGLGKTHFTLQQVYALASGTDIEGTPIRCPQPRDVVYITQEDEVHFIRAELSKQFPDLKDRPEVTKRIRLISTAIQGETLFLTNPHASAYLTSNISEGAVFFLDSFSTFLTSNENDNNQILKGEIAQLRNMMKEKKATAQLLHHRPKPNQVGQKASSRGAIAIPQVCRFHIMLEKTGTGVQLSFEKVSRGVPPDSINLFFDQDRRLFIPRDADKYMAAIKPGETLTTAEIMHRVGLDPAKDDDRKPALNALGYRSRRGGPIIKASNGTKGLDATWRRKGDGVLDDS
jgi:AAA domain